MARLATIARFDVWLIELRRGESPSTEEGLHLARERRAAMKELIASDPREALARAVPRTLRAELPPEIRAELETPIDAFARYEVVAGCHGTHAGLQRWAVIDGAAEAGHGPSRRYAAHVFGRRLAALSKHRLPIHGIALDDQLAIDEAPFRRLESGELGDVGIVGATDVVVAVGDRVQAFNSPAALQAWAAQVENAEAVPDPAARLAGPEIAAAPAGWTFGEKTVLWIRADFSDEPGLPASDSDIQAVMTRVSDYFLDVSNGRSSFRTVIVPVALRLSKTMAAYNTDPLADTEIRAEALALARAYDLANGNTGTYNPDRHDRWIVITRRVPVLGVSGRGFVGAAGVFLNGTTSATTIAHELGHNHGLHHADGWRPASASPAGPGEHSPYGDVFDLMGSGIVVPGAHFSSKAKEILGYLATADIQAITASGTYRVFRHDHRNAAGTRALRIPAGSYEYWIESRQLAPTATFTQTARLRDGMLVLWSKYPSTLPGRGTYLLDATPNSPPGGGSSPGSAAGFDDAPFRNGEPFTDPERGIRITAMSKGGSAPNEWIDVRIDFATDTNPPAILTPPRSQTAQFAQSVTLAVDANGVGLRYQWFKDGVAVAGATNATYTIASMSAADAGAYTVAVTSPGGTVTTAAAMLTLSSEMPFAFTTLAGGVRAAATVDGVPGEARFNAPAGIAVDRAGNIYVSDVSAHVVRKLSTTGVVTTLAGLAGVTGTADGHGAGARFWLPRAVAVDRRGYVYVADANNNTIRKISPGGVVTTLAGLARNQGSVDGTGAAARFILPSSVACDDEGNLFVTESAGHTVRKITPEGVVTTLAGSARQTGSADGPGAAARFNSPDGIAVDATGHLYVADRLNHTIRRITPGGIVTTLAGQAGESAHVDGAGPAARFTSPNSVALDPHGNLYVASSTTIRKISPEGVVTTVGGSPGSGAHADAIGTLARFNSANGIACDSIGTLYLADTSNTVVRRGTPLGRRGAQLANLSVRSFAGIDNDTLIVGFSVSGGAKSLLIRAIGPTLGAFGVGGALADPTLQLEANGTILARNDDWHTPAAGDASLLTAAAANVGAFALPAQSKDAALLQPLAAGAYTAQIGGGTGVTLVELYDAGGSSVARLGNVSARTRAGVGSDLLIVGFVVAGDAPKTVLIRAVGPSLGLFGLAGALAAPRLELFRDTMPLADNTRWAGAARLAAAFSEVGAFPLPVDSQDAVLLVTLLPGAYTAQVSAAVGVSGVALVEIYDVP